MKTLTEQLAKYAQYHRNRRNIQTHFVGIPLIVLAVAVLLSRPSVHLGAVALSPAVAVVAATLAYYLLLDLGLGLAMAVLLGLALWFGAWSAEQATGVWLAIGLGTFTVGWVFQFVGHYFEGKKPAFVDDIIGLVIGPLFVLAELLFLLGFRQGLRTEIETRAAPGGRTSL